MNETRRRYKPGDLSDQFDGLMDAMKSIAPDNTAAIPVSTMLEEGVWFVDLHVRLERRAEFEVSASAETLPRAIAAARGNLLREAEYLRIKAKTNQG